VMLPGLDGITICRAIRSQGVNTDTAIMMLTARDTESDTVLGLESGADDYLAKPFAISELLARVRALGRRGPVLRDEVIVVGDVEIDLGGKRVTVAGKSVAVTARELAIVEVLAKNRGRVVTREHLMEAVWGNVSTTVAGSLEVLVARIRRKFGGPSAPIRTVRGIGYSLEVE